MTEPALTEVAQSFANTADLEDTLLRAGLITQAHEVAQLYNTDRATSMAKSNTQTVCPAPLNRYRQPLLSAIKHYQYRHHLRRTCHH